MVESWDDMTWGYGNQSSIKCFDKYRIFFIYNK